jgi:hypothetical protein
MHGRTLFLWLLRDIPELTGTAFGPVDANGHQRFGRRVESPLVSQVLADTPPALRLIAVVNNNAELDAQTEEALRAAVAAQRSRIVGAALVYERLQTVYESAGRTGTMPRFLGADPGSKLVEFAFRAVDSRITDERLAGWLAGFATSSALSARAMRDAASGEDGERMRALLAELWRTRPVPTVDADARVGAEELLGDLADVEFQHRRRIDLDVSDEELARANELWERLREQPAVDELLDPAASGLTALDVPPQPELMRVPDTNEQPPFLDRTVVMRVNRLLSGTSHDRIRRPAADVLRDAVEAATQPYGLADRASRVLLCLLARAYADPLPDAMPEDATALGRAMRLAVRRFAGVSRVAQQHIDVGVAVALDASLRALTRALAGRALRLELAGDPLRDHLTALEQIFTALYKVGNDARTRRAPQVRDHDDSGDSDERTEPREPRPRGADAAARDAADATDAMIDLVVGVRRARETRDLVLRAARVARATQAELTEFSMTVTDPGADPSSQRIRWEAWRAGLAEAAGEQADRFPGFDRVVAMLRAPRAPRPGSVDDANDQKGAS